MNRVIEFLRDRPTRPALPRRAIGGAVAGILVWLAFGAAAVWVGRPLLDDMRLGAGGVLAETQSATVACVPKPLLHLCTVQARYTAFGEERWREVEMLTFWNLPGSWLGPLRVRFDPDDPDRIATSWGTAMLGNRARLLLAFLLGLLVMTPEIGRGFRAWWHVLALRRTTLRPVVAEVLDVVPGREGAVFHLAWADPAAGTRRDGRAPLARGLNPVWADAEGRGVVALAGTAGEVVLPDLGFETLALDAGARAALREAALGAGRFSSSSSP